jgi:hypothetical protein
VSANATETMTVGASFGTNGPQQITVGGVATAGDVVAFVVSDAGLSGGQKTVSYTVQTGDDLSAVAAGLAGAVNEIVWTGKNTQDLLVVKMLLNTGARVSELVNIKLSDVDF